MLLWVSALAVGLVTGCPVTTWAISYTFTTIDVPGAIDTQPYGVNDAGQIVGTFVDPTFFLRGFLLTSGGFTTIDVPGATDTQAFGVNDAGQIVGYFIDPTGLHGFLLSGGGFTTIDVPGATFTVAHGVNDAGQIVGYFADPTFGLHGFLLTSGGFTTIDPPGAQGFTVAYGINDAGQIVGYFIDPTSLHGFLLSGGGFTTIDVPGTLLTLAHGINDAGQIVGDTGNGFGGFLATPAAVSGAGTLVLVTSGLLALGGRQTVCSAACRRKRARLREAEARAGRDDEIRALLTEALWKLEGLTTRDQS